MKMFTVEAGTKVKLIKTNTEWYTYNFVDHTLKHDQSFFLEDVRIDPVGRVANCRGNVTVGSAWAEAGFYGFQCPANRNEGNTS